MNLIDENYNTNKNNKKIFILCGVAIVVLLIIVMVLLAYVSVVGEKQIKIQIDGNKYTGFIEENNVIYMNIEDLTKDTKNIKNTYYTYNYKSGSKNDEYGNKCYITDTYETINFEVDSNKVYKELEETQDVEYYTLKNAIIKKDDKMYIAVEDIETVMNLKYSRNGNAIELETLKKIENTVLTKSDIVEIASNIPLNSTYDNKKLLKKDLVIIQDESGNLGIGKLNIDKTTVKKKTVYKVSATPVLSPKYMSIKYREQFNQLIVETQDGKGIVQLEESQSGISFKTKVAPLYEEIEQIRSEKKDDKGNIINEDLFLISKKVIKPSSTPESSTTETVKKYGIINDKGDILLPVDYDKIGIDALQFTNNKIEDKYVIYDTYIPVKQNNVWKFANLKGKVVGSGAYQDLGYTELNSESNVLLIPEIEAIVVKKEGNYIIINKSERVLVKNVATKIYQERENDKYVYYMVLAGKKYNILDYVTK